MSTEANVQDSPIPHPVNPPKGWGVVKRKHTVRDFQFSLRTALVGLFSFSIARLSLHYEWGLAGKPVHDLFYSFAGTAAFFALFAAWMASSNPSAEAKTQMRERRKEWIRANVIPYLEQKYNVEFLSCMTWYAQSAHVRSKSENRSFEVRIHGIRPILREDDEFDLELDGELWMEEVVKPKQVSFRALPIAVNNE